MTLTDSARTHLKSALLVRWPGIHAEDLVRAVEVALSHEDEAAVIEGAEPSLDELHAAFMRVRRAPVVSAELGRFLGLYRVTRR